MKVIATKSTAVGILYTVCLLVGLLLLGMGIGMSYMLIPGTLLTVFSFCIVIDYFMLPKNVIMINSDNHIVLHKNIIIKKGDLIDVSYRRASAKGIQYKWGTVKIESKKGVFKYRYLNNCEKVSKELMGFIYKMN